MHKGEKVIVVIPNWNGVTGLKQCIDSVLRQSLLPHLIVVDNSSNDGSVAFIEKNYPAVELIKHVTNKGYAGGVNPGFKRALELNVDYVAPFNNDAVADKDWLGHLVQFLDDHADIGIAAGKVTDRSGSRIDTTGECYSSWGLPYPRGRNETPLSKYDTQTAIFAASGAASLYRVAMLREIGLLDEDFFAYYEDVDISFRAQLAGWKVGYVPNSLVYHELSATAKHIKGFFTYQTMKNIPMLFIKNVPLSLFVVVLPRFALAYLSFFATALGRGQLQYALTGFGRSLLYMPRKVSQRRRIQKNRKVSAGYIASMLSWDLPPDALRLRKLRGLWWKLARKGTHE